MLTRLIHELRLFAVALQFLTRWPVPAPGAAWNEQWLTDCVRHFPAIGALVGAACGLVLWAACHLWPPVVSALLAVAAGVWWTGAFHEDGLADTFDALGGHTSRERALVIMKDSRIGSYGAMALLLVTAMRVLTLSSLAIANPLVAAAACVWTHALARWVSVAVMARLPYAGDAEHAKAKPLAMGVPARQVWAALLWLLPLALAAYFWTAGALLALLATAAAALAVVAGMRHWLRQRLGGYTGDTLGAAEQLAEAAVLLALVASLGAA